MKLDEYLEALEKSSDEELTKLGVDNNYLIILKAKYDEVKSDLSKIFKLKEGVKFFSGGEMFEYISGSVEAHIFEGAVSWSLDEKEREKKMKEYNLSIQLHKWLDRQIPNVTRERALAIVIKDISNYVKEKNISACFDEVICFP